jgi:hypothetical protein
LRILNVKAHSQYGGTRLFSDHAHAALAARGFDVKTIDLTLGNPNDILFAEVGGGWDLVFSINILGEVRDTLGRPMAEIFGCPHVVWHTDYILSQWTRLEQTPDSTPLLVVDPTQIDAAHAACPPGRFPHMSFFPHPAVGEPAPDDADVDAFLAGRPIAALWSGGFVKPERPWKDAPKPTQQVFDDAVDLALGVEWMPPHEAFATVLRSRGMDVQDPEQRGVLQSSALVDAEVRVTRRNAFLLALAKTRLPIHICGNHWEPHLYRFKGAIYHGAVDMTVMAELMRQSRIVLNTNGNFGAGSHERPFSGALAGAAVFSDTSRYYEQVFRAGENIELFRWKDLDAGMAQLMALAADPQRCFGYARAAKAEVVAHHTWDRRIDLILQAAGIAA